jgi:histidinol phosphatase-like enzyme (inositol monophosphatase family)
MSQPNLDSLLHFALDAAWQAGRITLGYFQTSVDVERKGDHSPVTRADREAEQRIRALVAQYWPGHGVIGEEYGEQGANADYCWIIDPIDGTKSFISGVPLYGCLIALTHRGEPLVGVAAFPALNETVYASKGGGCFWNGRKASVSNVRDLREAVLLGSDVHFGSAEAQGGWERLQAATRIQRTWGDAYGYALVATGRAELMLDPKMRIWDSGPFGVILPEAGGTFTDWQGKPGITQRQTLATNGHLLNATLNVLAKK